MHRIFLRRHSAQLFVPRRIRFALVFIVFIVVEAVLAPV